MNKNILAIGLLILVSVIGLAMYGCSQTTSGTGGDSGITTTNYALSGKLGSVTASGLRAKTATTVTHIAAIGADNNKTLVTPEADGAFSLGINSGQPYVLGFFNKTGSAITLLGYLRAADYDWDSLPLIDPAGSSTDLGTVEIDSVSVEATPSINITSLIGAMNMNTATATLYGEIDDSLTALTNLDLDGNGEFDFNENRNYLFQTYIGMSQPGSPSTGEIDSMLDGYNDTYKPVPSFFQIYFSAIGGGDTRTVGTSATLTTPSPIGGSTTQTATTGALGSDGFTLFFPSVSTPEIAPAGTYMVEMGSTTYTIKNFKSSDVVALGSNNNIVYPVFHLITNEAGKVTTVQYVWKKLVSGTITAATSAEVLAAINYDVAAAFLSMNPFISFFSDANTLHQTSDGTKFWYLTPTPTDLDVSALNISRADIHHIQAGYELTSKVICKFDLY